MNPEENNINLCNVNIDIFYNILISMNDLSKAVKWIRICKREDQFRDNISITRLFCNHYRNFIISLYYPDMIQLFANNKKIFYILFEDESFWVSKILYDMKGKKFAHLENKTSFSYHLNDNSSEETSDESDDDYINDFFQKHVVIIHYIFQL